MRAISTSAIVSRQATIFTGPGRSAVTTLLTFAISQQMAPDIARRSQ